MAKEYRITVPAHPSIYDDKAEERELDIVFYEPDGGITKETGLLLLIGGFGDSLETDYLVQARNHFADQHNLVVVQSTYFGARFMQDAAKPRFLFNVDALRKILTPEHLEYVYDGSNVNIERFFEIGREYPMEVEGTEVLAESLSDFNDMGIMQAVDQITAVYAVLAVLKDNDYKLNPQRYYVYGQGHGAYLGYVSNALAPHLFTCLVDNSAWLFPSYLRSNRVTTGSIGSLRFSIIFEYLISQMDYDYELYHLPHLYKQIRNQARIISYHGKNDSFVTSDHKKSFCNSVRLSTCHEITSDKVDGDLFHSTQHGLGADYIKLFDHAVSTHSILGEAGDKQAHPNQLQTKRYVYHISFGSGLPVLSREDKRKTEEKR